MFLCYNAKHALKIVPEDVMSGEDYMKSYLNVKTKGWSGWIMIPLRLFLGLTFVYAGLQKLFDPQFFNSTARGYIGRQITAFAFGSPIHTFLATMVAPHALLFGILVIFGELAIGLCTLLGLLARPAALVGMVLNLVFFLSADWHIFPYFYGSDIVFLFCWLTLLLAGPANQALPVLDTRLATRLLERASPKNQPFLVAACAIILGIKVSSSNYSQFRMPSIGQPPKTGALSAFQPTAQAKTGLLSAYASSQPERIQAAQTVQGPQQSRRNFLLGTATGGGAMLALVWLVALLRLNPGGNRANSIAQTQITPTLGSPVASNTPTNASLPGEIAPINSVPVNSAFNFTLPSNNTFNGDPGILIHLNNGQFVAYDAVCPHAGCPVDYDPDSQNLICPCHGATFNPAKAAEIINGPAQVPLISVPIKVDQQKGVISLNQP